MVSIMDQNQPDSFLPISAEDRINDLVDTVAQRMQAEYHSFPLPPRTDPAFIAKFIRAKKYNPDSAYLAIHKYYDNMFSNLRILEGIKGGEYFKTYKMDALRILRHQFNGSYIIHIPIKYWDTKVASLREVEQATSFVLEELLAEPLFQVNGTHAIIDGAGLSFAHCRQITVSEIKFALQACLNTYPVRIIGIHIVNAPTLFWPIHKIIMKLLPAKLQRRVHLHSNYDSVVKSFSPDILPKSLGGNLDDEIAYNTEIASNIVSRNICYDGYWNGATFHRPRRLSRKRSSMMMVS